ncbi:MAG: energy coupling factor transporter S component ThiW [Clostridia bacterium]|nr:energy coupling factor transporter S component ThiW [Clostridia bacterium]
MSKTRKLAIAGILIAVGVVCAPFSIPIGAARCLPVQHMINVIAAVILGPGYAVAMAFITSLIRVATGTGTLLAFPGSMVGALCAGLMYKFGKKLGFAFVGEVVGTGILGAILAYPIATLIMGREAALFGFVVPFLVSTIGGSIIATIIILALEKTGLMKKLKS